MATNALDQRGWQVGKSLYDSLQYMLDNEIACDVTFDIQFVGNPHVKVSAHKMILQARSPVFEAMFGGAFLESSQDVIITDISPSGFKMFLRYLYTDSVDLTGENILCLLRAADKYIVEGLTQKCRAFLRSEVCVENVCSVLTHSLLYCDKALVSTCLNLIAPNVEAVTKTEAFYRMSHDALLRVVSYEQLVAGKESVLFQGCLAWARRNVPDPESATDEDIRELLGECIHKIRFPFIPIDELADKFGNMSVLTEREKSLFYPLALTGKESYSAALKELGFEVASRMMRCNLYANGHGSHIGAVDCTLTNEAFTFTVNKPIQFMGTSVYGGREGAHHVVTVILQSLANEDIKYASKTEITSPGNGKPIAAHTKKIRVPANSQTRVCVVMKGDKHTGYGSVPNKTVIIDGATFTLTDRKHPSFPASRGYQGGYVADILFQRLPC